LIGMCTTTFPKNTRKKLEERTNKERSITKFLEEWKAKHPDFVTKVMTKLGLVEVVGDVYNSHIRWNGKFICVIPEKQIAEEDHYIVRLFWLNYRINEIMKIIVKRHILQDGQCQYCGEKGLNFEKWSYCPYCGDLLEAQINRIIKTGKKKKFKRR